MKKPGKGKGFPRAFYVRCWKCGGRIYLCLEQPAPAFAKEPMGCPMCGAVYVIARRRVVRISKVP